MADRSIIPTEEKERANQAAINGDVDSLAAFLDTYKGYPELLERYAGAGFKPGNDAIENARLIICHTHCFNDWSEFEAFQKEMGVDGSAIQQFEQAADAITNGDEHKLKALLQQNPDLISLRSVRNHHSTLLNYVGANGFEGYRQRTPKNAVEIAEILLNAGAEIDAKGDMYRGTTTLGLVATSVHPVKAGVQQQLMELLIANGADVNHAVASDYTDGMLILACLANGRNEPINYLAEHGATVDLEAAGGVGDLEKVKSYFNADGILVDDRLIQKRDKAFIWACSCGHRAVVEYLLSTGVGADTVAGGYPALHCAIHGGHLEIVKLLLDKDAPLEAKNAHGGTALGGAIWSAYHAPLPQHPEIIELLTAAGAKVHDGWRDYIDELRNKGQQP